MACPWLNAATAHGAPAAGLAAPGPTPERSLALPLATSASSSALHTVSEQLTVPDALARSTSSLELQAEASSSTREAASTPQLTRRQLRQLNRRENSRRALFACRVVRAAGSLRCSSAALKELAFLCRCWTLEEVKQHNSLASAWIAVDGRVYDITGTTSGCSTLPRSLRSWCPRKQPQP